MARQDWVIGDDRGAAAAERIYSAASEIAHAEGLDALDIDALAARLHCSRATIYRHAGGKAHIRDMVLIRLASGIVETVQQAVDGLVGADRVVTAITVALKQIRSDPIQRMMLMEPSPSRLGDLHRSTLLTKLAADLTGITDDDSEAAQWIVRVVLSFAHWPPHDTRAEQRILARFVAPAF